MSSLLAGLKAVCATFPDLRKGRRGTIAMAGFGLSAFAMFFMRSASFLTFQRALEKGQGRSNGQTLFGIERIPSGNSIREALDEAGAASALFRTLGDAFRRTGDTRKLRSIGRRNSDRLGRNRILLLAKAGLFELSDPQAIQRQDRELPLFAAGGGRGARPLQGRSPDA